MKTNKMNSLFIEFKLFNGFVRNAEIYINNREKVNDPHMRDHIKRAAYYGVKSFSNIEKPKHLNEAETNFQIGNGVKEFIALLTPKEFMEVFPIRKEYDGHKWETKDYFYTRDYINSLNANEPIGNEEVLHLLWEYVNNDIDRFNVKLLLTMSDLRRLNGYPSIASEWAEMNDIETMTLHEGVDGKKFLMDKQGNIMKVNKKKPRYLKVVK